jgi:hypothetical protein
LYFVWLFQVFNSYTYRDKRKLSADVFGTFFIALARKLKEWTIWNDRAGRERNKELTVE